MYPTIFIIDNPTKKQKPYLNAKLMKIFSFAFSMPTKQKMQIYLQIYINRLPDKQSAYNGQKVSVLSPFFS